MSTNFNIKRIVKYGLILITVVSLIKMCSKNIYEQSKPSQDVWGHNSYGAEVIGKVQNINGKWKGTLRDIDGNECQILNMGKAEDSSYFAYDTNGKLFTLYFK